MDDRILRIRFLLLVLGSHPTLLVVSSPIIRVETFPFDDDFFHYQVPFVVYFDFETRADALNATWSVPDDCTIQKTRSFTRNIVLEVMCSQPGEKLIKLKQNASFSEISKVTLGDNLECYSWYTTAQAKQYANGTWSTTVHVWVVDHRHSTDEERLLDALLPSKHSETLTLQFYYMGEEPHLQLIDITYNSHVEITQVGFNASIGAWKFLLMSSSSGEVPLVVRGSGVIILGCGIRDGVSLVSISHVNGPSLTLASTTILTDGKTKLVKHLQEPNIGILILQNGTYLSSNYFKTFEELRLPSQGVSNLSVDDATFLEKNLLLLIDSNVYVIDIEEGSLANLTRLDASVDRIQAASSVVREANRTSALQLPNGAVVVWNGKNQSEEFLLSMDGGLTFSSIFLPISASSLLIWSISFHPFHPVVVLLATSYRSKTKSMLYYYQYIDNQWETQTSQEYLLGFNSEVTQPHFTWFPRGSGELLLWDSSRVYYSSIAGRVGFLLRFVTGPYLKDEPLMSNEFIQEIHAGLDGTFVILTTINRLFVGLSGKEHVLLVTTVARPGSYVSLAFDGFSRLLVVTAQSSYRIERHYPPLRQLIQNSLQRDLNCPYIHWSSNFPTNLYYIDMNEMLQLWSYLVPKAWKSNELTIIVSDSFILNVTIESAEQLAATTGIIVRNETIRLSETSASSSLAETSRIVSVKIMPANSSLLCSPPREAVSHLLLGCPPYRTIRMHSRNDEDSDYCKSYLNYQKSSSRQPKYNYSVYGCPLRVKYRKTFLPSLDLYDNQEVVESVSTDFIVIDELSNSGLSYTHTAKEVGCLRTPQWLKQLKDRLTVNFTVPSQGYHSCFNDSGDGSSDASLHEDYPLLNSSSPNRLRLSSGDGLYLFTARVIESGYSYCSLETRFAVEIYGTPFRSVAGYAVLGSCCFVGITTLIVVYYMQRHEIRKLSSDDKDK